MDQTVVVHVDVEDGAVNELAKDVFHHRPEVLFHRRLSPVTGVVQKELLDGPEEPQGGINGIVGMIIGVPFGEDIGQETLALEPGHPD